MKAGSRTGLLGALALSILVFGAALVLAFRDEQRHILQAEADLRTGSWIAVQAERETLRLVQALTEFGTGVAADRTALELQVDLLASRLDLLTAGDESQAIWAEPALAALAAEAKTGFLALEPDILALSRGDRAALAGLTPRLMAVDGKLRDIVQQVMVADRASQSIVAARHGFWAFAAFLALMLAAMAGLIVQLLREVRSRSVLLNRAIEAEGAAVKARGRLIDAIEAADDAFALFDEADRLIVCNSKYRETYPTSAPAMIEGVRFEEILRSGLARGELVAAIGREEEWLQERLAAHRAPGEPLIQELPGGRWVRISERRTRDGGVVGFRTDITALKRREQELAELAEASQQAQRRLMEAIEAIPGSFALYDAEERLVLWNSKRETLYGDARGRLSKGQTYEEIIRSAVRRQAFPQADGADAQAEAWIRSALAWHRSPGSAMEFQTRDGRWIRSENRRSADGGIVVIGLDVTETKERDRQLSQAQKMEALGQLTGGVAHDFNNLLLVVRGNAERALELLAEGTPARPLIVTAQTAADRGASLVRRLLAFSRTQQLAPELLDVNERVAGVERMLQRTLGEHIEIALSLAPALGQVRVDAAQLDTALLNLAINARDAMANGGRLLIEAAETSLAGAEAARLQLKPGRYVRLTVSDTGTGMPAHVIERAFEPFFTTKEVGEGTGLGLSMVYGLLRQSEGAVDIRSRLGEGTAIDLLLPVAASPRAQAEASAKPGAAARGDETILVVEDEPSVRELVVYLLGDLGYAVLEAENGREALARLGAETKVDLLLTDLVMPGGMGGRALAEEAARLRPGLRVLFTSGYSADTVAEAGRRAFEGRLLRKPYGKAELAAAVRAALEDAPRADAA